MTRRVVPKKKKQTGFDLDEALANMNADELRELAHDMFLELDNRAHNRIVNSLMDRAARNKSGWHPDGPPRESIEEIVSFAEHATQNGYADPEEVDDYLQEGSNAFLSKDYQGATEIFRALLLPISEAEIDLGQHEMLDEVLSIDVSTCAAQYVVATYMITAKESRAEVVKETMLEVYYEGHFWHPLEALEKTSIEPLPDFDRFLLDWRKMLETNIEEGRRYQNDDQNGWLREVVQRMEGADGLAKIARKTKRFEYLRAWCTTLVEAKDWNAAFAAYKEASDIVVDKEYAGGDFLDGVALAAQELGKRNLAEHLEKAWREAPSLVRLVRWLGDSKNKTMMTKRAKQALDVCPKNATRQKALLHFITSDFNASGKILGNAPGLGWSSSEHPGHLIFPLFYKVLGGRDTIFESGYRLVSTHELTFDELEWFHSNRAEPLLKTPTVDAILNLANVPGDIDSTRRNALLQGMKKAADKRVSGVTGKGRRKYYAHAAQLVAACLKVDSSEETIKWVNTLKKEYRRYPALQAEFSKVLK